MAEARTSEFGRGCSRYGEWEVSGLAGGVEHGGIHGFARGRAGPDHELECLEVALTGVERRVEQRLALFARGFDAARQHQRIAEHHQTLARPQVEMADPQLLIDMRQQLPDLGLASVRHLQIERTGKMQCLELVHPCEGYVVVAPASPDGDRDLVVGGSIEGPVMDGSEAFDDIDGIDVTLAGEVDQRHAVPHASDCTCKEAHAARRYGTGSGDPSSSNARITWPIEYNASTRVVIGRCLQP